MIGAKIVPISLSRPVSSSALMTTKAIITLVVVSSVLRERPAFARAGDKDVRDHRFVLQFSHALVLYFAAAAAASLGSTMKVQQEAQQVLLRIDFEKEHHA